MTEQALFSFLIFFFPGIVFIFRNSILSGYSQGEKFVLAIPISFAYWIVGFWWLRIMPVPLTAWVYLSLGATLFFAVRSRKQYISPTDRTIKYTRHFPFFLFLVVVLVPQILLISRQIAPSGPDMSMHTYIASVILRANGFPLSMAPIVPVDHFGLYPFGFSALTAVLGVANGMPAYTNALLLSSTVHLLFDFALYLVLRSRFTPLVSALTAVIVGWVSANPHMFMVWGANPSVLSLTFFFLAIALSLADRKPVNTWLAVLFLSASFLTNYMFVVAGLYIALPVIIVLLIRSREKQRFIKNMLKIIGAFCLFILPFIGKIMTSTWQISDAARQSVQTYHYEETAAWTGTVSLKGLMEIFSILAPIMDPYLLVFFGLVCIYLFRTQHKTILIHLYIAGAICLLIMNARHWWLPWSSVLYPYRISLTLLMPIAWSTALFFRHIRQKNRWASAASIIIVLIIFIPRLQFSRVLRESKAFATVTRSDISAMAWLASHSSEQNVIWNRYEDAGLWIPAIISRPITLYHTNPVDLSGLTGAERRLPDYAFVGAAIPQGLPIADEVAATYPDAKLWRFDIIYHNGNTAVYKITR